MCNNYQLMYNNDFLANESCKFKKKIKLQTNRTPLITLKSNE